MRLWETEIKAINPVTGELCIYNSMVAAYTPGLAHEYCQTHGLGYMRVTGDEIIAEGTYDDKTGKITSIQNYDNLELN